MSFLFGCAVEYETVEPTNPDAGMPPDVMVDTPQVPDVRCAAPPVVGAATGWRHTTSDYIAGSGSPHHRGIDLIAVDTAATQTLTGKIAYGAVDKDLQDEDIELFACLASQWQLVGTARTNSDGRFELVLAADQRLPIGMRDMYLSVTGDRSSAAFLAFVAPAGTRLVVSDVDGTLTASESAYPQALAIGGDVPVQPDAPAALMSAAVKGHSIIYITARGDRFTQDTRDWFKAKGFPRGPMRLPPAIITQPGADTIEFKTSALESLAAFDVVVGIGNRASDIAAYGNAGVDPSRIMIKLPEFTDEVTADLTAGKATGFSDYDALRMTVLNGL